LDYMHSDTLETTGGEIRGQLRDLRLMGAALLINFIIVPLLGLVLVKVFVLPPDTKAGFLMLALSPGGPFALQFARVSKGNRVLAVALLFIFSSLAVLTTPVLVALLFPAAESGRLPFTELVALLMLILVVPVFAGRAWQRLAPTAAPKLGQRLGVLSIVIFIIGAMAGSKYRSSAIKSLGAGGIEAIVVLTLCSWVISWLLGGPEVRNRKVLAISTSMRNVGVCWPIAVTYFPGTEVVVPILAFSGISIPMNMVFALITGLTLRDTEVSARPARAGTAERSG
jgi:predicted Na+-dependent transporter